LSECDIVLFTS